MRPAGAPPPPSRTGSPAASFAPRFDTFSPRRWAAPWAVAAFLGAATVVQVVAVPQLKVNGVHPDLILLLVVARSMVAGGPSAVVWGFVGGLWMDLFSGGAMGASSLALMAAALLTGIGHNAIFRRNLIVPSVSAFAGSLLFSLVYLTIMAVTGHRIPAAPVVAEIVLPAALYNAAAMLLVAPFLNRLPERADYP